MADIKINFENAKEAVKLVQGFCDQFESCFDCPFSKPVVYPHQNESASVITECKIGNPWEYDMEEKNND